MRSGALSTSSTTLFCDACKRRLCVTLKRLVLAAFAEGDFVERAGGRPEFANHHMRTLSATSIDVGLSQPPTYNARGQVQIPTHLRDRLARAADECNRLGLELLAELATSLVLRVHHTESRPRRAIDAQVGCELR